MKENGLLFQGRLAVVAPSLVYRSDIDGSTELRLSFGKVRRG